VGGGERQETALSSSSIIFGQTAAKGLSPSIQSKAPSMSCVGPPLPVSTPNNEWSAPAVPRENEAQTKPYEEKISSGELNACYRWFVRAGLYLFGLKITPVQGGKSWGGRGGE